MTLETMAAEFEAQVADELTVLLLLRAGCEDDEIAAYVRLMDKETN